MTIEDLIDLLEHRFEGANVCKTEIEVSAWPLSTESINVIAYTRVTSSYNDGPEHDYSKSISSFLKKFGYIQIDHRTSGCDERNLENSETYFYFKTYVK